MTETLTPDLHPSRDILLTESGGRARLVWYLDFSCKHTRRIRDVLQRSAGRFGPQNVSMAVRFLPGGAEHIGAEIETSIRQGGKEHLSAFGLISAFEIVRETRDGRMLDVEITLADWVFDAIENNNVLTLNRQYFFLRKPLERRLYEIARKHCGAQSQWKIGLELLRDKCGSSSTVKEFRRLLGKIIDDDGQHDHMPDYTFLIEEDVVIVRPKKETHQSALPLPLSSLRLAPDTHEDARRLAPGWDMHHLEDEWRSWGVCCISAASRASGFGEKLWRIV